MWRLGLLVVGLWVGLGWSSGASGGSIGELVVNGEFEAPVFNGDAGFYSNSDVPGWSNSSEIIEIWGPNFGAPDQPELGSDGVAHGQSHEVTFQSQSDFTTEVITIPETGNVDFTFDTWRRASSGIA